MELIVVFTLISEFYDSVLKLPAVVNINDNANAFDFYFSLVFAQLGQFIN